MTTEPTVKQLPDGDAVFLSTETDTAWGHIGGMSILDPTGVPDFSFEKLVSVIEQRLVHVPRFRWKLLEVPFGLDRPYWVEVPDSTCGNTCTGSAYPAPAAWWSSASSRAICSRVRSTARARSGRSGTSRASRAARWRCS